MNVLINLKEKKKELLSKKNFFCIILIIIIFSLDRISKQNIINNFNNHSYFVNDFINFDLIWNIGIGFGFLSTDSFLIYNLITLIIGFVILILFYFLVLSEKLDKLIYSV